MKFQEILKMKYTPRTLKYGPRIMYAISNAVIFTTSLKEFYLTIQKELGKAFDTSNLFICSYNREDDTLTLPYLVDEKNNVDVTARLSASKTLTGYMIHEDRPMLIQEDQINQLIDSGRIEMIGSPSKIWMGIPLKILDKTVGALVVQSYKDASAYSKRDLELLSFISNQVSMSIETKRIQEEARLEKAYFKQLFEESPECMILVSGSGRIQRVNREFEQIFGYKRGEVLNKHVDDLIVPEEYRAESRLCGMRIKKGLNITKETVRRKKDGSLIDVSVMAAPIRTEGQEPTIFSLYRDISQQKQAEHNLRESEEKLRNILNSSPNSITISDLRGYITEFNPAALEIFECDDPSQLRGKHGNEFVVPEMKEIGKKILLKVMRRGQVKNLEVEIHTLKGKHRYLDLSASLIRDDEGNPIGVVTINQDITQKKLAEQALQEHQQLFKQITSSAKDGIVVLDSEGHVIFWNQSAEQIFGYEAGDILGADFLHMVLPDGKIDREKEGTHTRLTGLPGSPGSTMELKVKHRDGHEFPVELSLSAMEVNERNHSVGIIRDITLRKNFERELKHSRVEAENANRAKSEFLANMSHEIRTPMNAILGFSEILEDSIGSDPAYGEYISGIRNSGKGLLSLINDILDLSKIEAGGMDMNHEPVNPYQLVEEIRQIFSLKTREKNLTFDILVDPSLPNCLVFDEVRVRQVMLNLIGNAVKFTSRGGITVKVFSVDQDEEASHVNVTIEVSDTGIGIPEEQQRAIFEPFRQQDGQSTRKYGGTGLGLSITQRLISMMGGSIRLHSKPGNGSTFTIYLPGVKVASLEECNSDPGDSHTGVNFRDARILVVEDIATNRKVIKGFLDHHGITIAEAEDGKIALEKVGEFKPQLILMDIQMPNMDGIEASERLRSSDEFNTIPIVALTASVMQKDKEKLNNLCSGYLRKPVSKLDLINELKKHLPHEEIKMGEEQESPGETERVHPRAPENSLGLFVERLTGHNHIPAEFRPLFIKGILPVYEDLNRNRSNRKIRNFAVRLIETGERLDLVELQAYGIHLKSMLESFNIRKIGTMLEEFGILKKAIV